MNSGNTQNPRTVEIHVLLKRIGNIDVLKECFEADIQIESQWIETDPLTNYDPEKMWNPKIYIPNANSIAKEDTKHSVSTDYSGRRIITEIKTIKGK